MITAVLTGMPKQRKGGIILFDYTGCECKSCGKKFTSEDDIVVCPECGTPYHRECWKKEGKCINTELHESHRSWKEANTAQSDAPVCKKCGNRFLSLQTMKRIPCPDCERDMDYEIGPDESLEDLLDTADLLQIVEGEEEVTKMDGLLSLAITGGDEEWI